MHKPIAILGAGSWGTALALYLARRGQTVRLWSKVESEITALLKDRSNKQFLPGHVFPETIHPTADLAEAVSGVDEVVMAVPSVGFSDTLTALKPHLQPHTVIICVTKGLDAATDELFSDVTAEIISEAQPFVVLSGPSFAKEVASGVPTAVTIASENEAALEKVKNRFDSDIFRLFPTKDVIGVELGGVVKNVIAISTGMSDGLGFGVNTRSAIITLGLSEITRLGVAMGGLEETFNGLSGMGDLILTCSDDQSRNRRLGLAIGRGSSPKEAENTIGQVVEGKLNAALVVKLAERFNVSMPICVAMNRVLLGTLSAKEAVHGMLVG